MDIVNTNETFYEFRENCKLRKRTTQGLYLCKHSYTPGREDLSICLKEGCPRIKTDN